MAKTVIFAVLYFQQLSLTFSSRFVVRILLADDQECLTPFPAMFVSTNADGLVSRVRTIVPSYYIVPPENCDVAERNFCVFAQPRNFCHRAQLSRNFGRFRAVFALIIFHFGEVWEQIGPLNTRNLFFSKFVAVCPKLATSCFHTSFHSRCHWAREARLMTLQRSLQYSLRLS